MPTMTDPRADRIVEAIRGRAWVPLREIRTMTKWPVEGWPTLLVMVKAMQLAGMVKLTPEGKTPFSVCLVEEAGA